MIRFEKITEENFDTAVDITVTEEQDMAIAPVVYSLAQCYIMPDILEPYLILNDNTPVGFILFIVDSKESQYEICRFMIDKNYQKNGYGKAALLKAIEYLKEKGAKAIELSHQTNNYGVGKLYESVGFVYTGVIEDGEVMMKLEFEQPLEHYQSSRCI